MAWIKRNLIFVIIIVVGLGLTGFCAFLFYQNLGTNTQAKADYEDAYNQLTTLQGKVPYPSEENIQHAEDDYKTAQQFLSTSGSTFADFPAPPKLDERGFKAYLENSIFELRNGAAAAGVQIPDNYAFGFSAQEGTLRYEAENIQPWVGQLEQIKALLSVFYQAKVNSIEVVRRVHVSDTDAGNGGDYIETVAITNQDQIITPYAVVFQGFSRDLANVLESLATASNCFIVKDLDVATMGDDSLVNNLIMQTPAATPDQPAAPPPPQLDENGRRMDPRMYRRMAQEAPPSTSPNASPVITQPMTILSERPLRVTLTVAVVRFNKGEGK